MFPRDSPADPQPPPAAADGDAAAAIREAETALARQNSVAAQVDLQVVTAVLNAHSAHAEGSAALAALQREIESAVSTRSDLDTPAGAREFQRFLIDRLQEIRAVVEDAHLDDTSRASLAAALASLYATAGTPAESAPAGTPVSPPGIPPPGIPPPVEPAGTPGAPVELGLEPGFDSGLGLDEPVELSGPVGGAAAGPAVPTGTATPPAPSWGGGVSAPALPPLGAMPSLAGLAPSDGPPLDGPADGPPETDAEETDAEQTDPSDAEQTDGPADLTGVIADAVAGTPIAEAFARQGITIPQPGTAVDAPLAAAEVLRGDVGVFADRHALALGNGKALVDNQIQPIDTVTGPGFLGWSHPPADERTTEQQQRR